MILLSSRSEVPH